MHSQEIPEYLVNFDPNSKTDWSGLSIPMQYLIKRAYDLFSIYKAPARFDVCTGCCMLPKEEEALRTLPLSSLPARLLYSYNDAAKSFKVSKNEAAYLLPRTMELIALNVEIHHSLELSFIAPARLKNELWTDQEKQLFHDFTLQYLIDQLHKAEQTQMILPLDELLIMVATGNIPIDHLLTYIAQSDSYYMIASVAEMIGTAIIFGSEKYIDNPFADDLPQLKATFNQWFIENIEALKSHARNAILSPFPVAYYQKYVDIGLEYIDDFPKE